MGQPGPHRQRPVPDAVGHPFSEKDHHSHLPRVTTTIICPTFILAANFVIVGRLIRKLGPKYCRMSPRLCELLSNVQNAHFLNIFQTPLYSVLVYVYSTRTIEDGGN